MKLVKLFISTLLSVAVFVLAMLVFVQTAKAQQDDVDYVYYVVNFSFSCPDTRRNRPETRVVINWGNRERSANFSCGSNKNSTTYRIKGVVVRMRRNRRLKFSELQVRATNASISRMYTQEPAEWNDDNYRRYAPILN